jgi:hypothetical protein
MRCHACLLAASTAVALAVTGAALAHPPPDTAHVQAAVSALRISTAGVSVRGTPRAPRSPAAEKLFTRRQGNEVGIDQLSFMSPREFFPPFWNGRGLSAGDVNRDGYTDLLLATSSGIRLYLNQQGAIFVPQEIEIPRLEQLGVHIVALVDLDDDGWLDILLTSYSNGNYFVLSDHGLFPESRLVKVQEHPLVLTNSLTFGDIDEDGDLDAVAGNWYYGYAKQIPPADAQNKLLFWQDGNFTPVPLTEEMVADTHSVLLSDWNLDDHLDLIVGNDFTPPDYFYEGDGSGGFRMVTRSDGIVPISTDTTMSIDTGDYNNDLKMDIYITQIAASGTGASARIDRRTQVAYCDDLNREADRKTCMQAVRQKLYFNFGPKHQPSNIARCKQISDSGDRRECAAMMTLLTAIRAQKPDLCERIPEFDEQVAFMCRNYFKPGLPGTQEEYARAIPFLMNENVLLVARPDGGYKNVARRMGVETTAWSWNGRFMDLDNDGWQDIYVVNGTWSVHTGTPKKFFFRNQRGERFIEETDAAGLQNYMLQSGFVRIDFDNDGDLDLITNSMNGPIWLYINNEAENSSILFELRDHRANRYCIGCKIRITYGGSTARRQLREVKSGGGFVSIDAPFTHFGLGSERQIEAVEVTWSTGAKTIIDGPLPADTLYTITRHGLAN